MFCATTYAALLDYYGVQRCRFDGYYYYYQSTVFFFINIKNSDQPLTTVLPTSPDTHTHHCPSVRHNQLAVLSTY